MEFVALIKEGKSGKGVFGARNTVGKLFEDFLNTHKGKHIRIIAKPARKPNKRHFGYLYGIVYPFIQAMVFADNKVKPSIDELDYFFKRKFWFEEVVNPFNNQRERVPKLKRNMNRVELIAYLEDLRLFCLEEWQCEPPTTDEVSSATINDEDDQQDYHLDTDITILEYK